MKTCYLTDLKIGQYFRPVDNGLASDNIYRVGEKHIMGMGFDRTFTIAGYPRHNQPKLAFHPLREVTRCVWNEKISGQF